MKKALKIILIVLAVIAVICVGAVHLVLFRADVRNKILNKALDGVVDARVGIEGMDLKLGKQTSLKLSDIGLWYPKDNPQALMLGIDSVCVNVNLEKFIKEKGIEVNKAHVYGLEAHMSQKAMNVLTSIGGAQKDSVKQEKEETSMPEIQLHDVLLDIREAQYLDMADLKGLRITATTDKDSTALKKRPARQMPKDLPDFLSEKDFRSSDLDIHLSKEKSDMIMQWDPTLSISLDTASVLVSAFPMRTAISEAAFRLNTDEVDIDTLNVRTGSSDLAVKGYVKGLKKALFGNGGVLFSDLAVRSGNLDISELLSALGSRTDTVATADSVGATVIDTNATVSSVGKLIVVPANLVANVDLRARNLSYADYAIKGFHTAITVRERCVLLSNINARTEYGHIKADAFYSTRTKQDISAGFDIQLGNVTAENVMKLLPVVDDIVPGFSTFKGDMNFAIAAKTQLDTTMSIIKPSMKGVFHMDGDRLSIDQTPEIRKITKWMLLKNKKVVDFHDLNINGIIDDNKVTIFPFAVSPDRYCLLLGGDYDLNGSADYRVSILKAPLLFRIGVRAFGKDKLKIRLCRPQFRDMEFPTFEKEAATVFKEIRYDVTCVLGEGSVKTMGRDVGIKRMRASRKSDFERLRLFNELPESQQKSLETLSKESLLPKIHFKAKVKVETEEETTINYE